MSGWTRFEKVACALIILAGLIVGTGICHLGQTIIDVKSQNYALMLKQGK